MSQLRDDTDWRPIVPVPDDAPECRWTHWQHGKPTHLFDYYDSDGRLVGHVARFDFQADGHRKKEFIPLTYCERGKERDWRPKGIPAPRPLYALRDLAKYPDAPVVVTEGEKAARWARKLFRDCVAVTSSGGAEAAAKTDWSALRNRIVLVWPDNDLPGARYAEDAARLAREAGAKEVRIVDVPSDFPDGWDLADRNPEGVEDADLDRLLDEAPEWRPDLGLGEWNAGDDDWKVPPRGWCLGNSFCRRFVSSLVGNGGVGKSAVRIAQAVSLATKRSLTGEFVHQRCRVLLISLEDGEDELRRRVRACLLYHNIRDEELDGWLYLAAPVGKGWKLTKSESSAPEAGELVERLAHVIETHGIDVVIIDPFVKAHAEEENANIRVEFATSFLAKLAIEHDCAMDAPHHQAKGAAEPGNANRARGASSFVDACRLVYTLTAMSEDEAKPLGLSENQRRSLVRMDSAKVNIAPPAASAHWFRLVSVPLGNETRDYPRGDHVQTVEPWTPPVLSESVASAILADIQKGTSDGGFFSDHPKAEERAAWRVVKKHLPDHTEEQARALIKKWVTDGVLVEEKYRDSASRRDKKGLKRGQKTRAP